MEVALLDSNDNKSSFLAMEVESVTTTVPFFLKWADQKLGATLVTSPKTYPVANRGGTANIDQLF